MTSLLSTTRFDYQPRTRIVFGTHSIERVGELAAELAGPNRSAAVPAASSSTVPVQARSGNALLVTDPGIVAAGHADRVTSLLEKAGFVVTRFDQVEENPSTLCVDKCVEVARQARIDLIIGLGGGSSMDTAKGCNFILTNGGRMQDYWGVGKATRPMLPLIAIPTTGGTGSECQSFALITDPATHQKMACGDAKAAARIALLDPALTISQPRRVTACSGIDAIAHAVETAVTRRRTPLSTVFSRESFRLLISGFPRVLRAADDLEARGLMQLGAAFAGIAIENSMLGAAHSAANPLTAHFGIPHGQAVGLMLPHVVRFNSADTAAATEYAELARLAHIDSSAPAEAAAKLLAIRLQEILELAGMGHLPSGCGLTRDALPKLAEEALRQWTAQFNPRALSMTDFQGLYSAVVPT